MAPTCNCLLYTESQNTFHRNLQVEKAACFICARRVPPRRAFLPMSESHCYIASASVELSCRPDADYGRDHFTLDENAFTLSKRTQELYNPCRL
jgi:hypothetical protein